MTFLLVLSSTIIPKSLTGPSLSSSSATLVLLALQCVKINFLTVPLCIIIPNIMKVINGRISKTKVIMTIKVELMASKTGTTVTMIIECKIKPSNALRVLLLYGLTMTCTKDITTLVAMREYCVIKKSDE